MKPANSGPKRQLPAFARSLLAKRRNGLAPVRDLLIACDWDVGKFWAWRIVVAPNDRLSELDFRVARGLSCLVLSWDDERMHDVARAVNACDPLRLIGVHLGGTRIHNYRTRPLWNGYRAPTWQVPETEHAA